MISKQKFLKITLLIRSQKHTILYKKITIFIIFRRRREEAEVDRQLEAAQAETARLRTMLRTREVEVSLFLNHFLCVMCTRLKQSIKALNSKKAKYFNTDCNKNLISAIILNKIKTNIWRQIQNTLFHQKIMAVSDKIFSLLRI